jgi:hypothetical protein
MPEHVFTPTDEARMHRESLAGLKAGNALDERVRLLPIRDRLEAWRRAGEGEDLRLVVAEIEGRNPSS